jgi:hypothetical protein
MRITAYATFKVTVPAGSSLAPSKAHLPAQTDPSYRMQNVVNELFGLDRDSQMLASTLVSYQFDYYGIPGAPGGVMEQVYPAPAA